MSFSEFNIDESDYEFFGSLPKDEKLLFLYDLICERAYGNGTEVIEYTEVIDADIIETDSELEIFDKDERFRNFISSSINPDIDINIFILNDKVIINSNSEEKLKSSVRDMLNDGLILYKHRLGEKAQYIFQHQEFCTVYLMAGKTLPINKN